MRSHRVQAPQHPTTSSETHADPDLSFVRRHPQITFAGTAIALTWAVQFTFLALGWPLLLAIVIELVVLLTTASLVTRITAGRSGVHRLYAGVLRWRFGAGWWVAVLAVLPVATIAVAGATGTVQSPSDGWGSEAFQYLFLTLVFGALLGNMWEELAWTGFFQSEMTRQHGLFKGALITAVPFGLIHLPLAFEEDGLGGTDPRDLALTWALLLLVAPFFRCLIGLVHERTDRSLVSVAVLHGSFNACASSSLVTEGWIYIVGAVLATPLIALTVTRGAPATERT